MKAKRHTIKHYERICTFKYGPCLGYSPSSWFLAVPFLGGPSYAHLLIINGEHANEHDILSMIKNRNWREFGFEEKPLDDWCEELWCPWSEVPIYTHHFEDGTIAKYGMAKVYDYQMPPSGKNYWFVMFEDTLSLYFVDEEVANPEFLDKFGPPLPETKTYPGGNDWREIGYGFFNWGFLDESKLAHQVHTGIMIDMFTPEKPPVQQLLQERLNQRAKSKKRRWLF